MSLAQLLIGWFYYGIFYMGLSIVATVLLNRVVKRYFTAPLLINAVGVLLLLVVLYTGQLSYDLFLVNVLFVYMPVVAASAVFNLGLYLLRGRRPLHEE